MARQQGRKKTPLKDLKPRKAKAAKVKGGGIEPEPFRETAGIEPQPFRAAGIDPTPFKTGRTTA
jgi:hypothetical protein